MATFSCHSQGHQFQFSVACLVLLCAVLLKVAVKEQPSSILEGKGEEGKEKKPRALFVEEELLSLIIDGPADRFANNPAITVGLGLPSTEKTWTHAQLHADAERTADILRHFMPHSSDNGMSHSSRIGGTHYPRRVMLAVSSKTDYHGFVVLLACFKNAYSYVNTAVDLSRPLFTDIVKRIQPSLILVDSITWNRYEMVRELVHRYALNSVVLAMDDDVPGVPCLFNDNYDLNGTSNHFQPEYSLETFPLDKEALIVFTSGSTGFPKMVASSFRQMLRVSSKAQKILGHHPESILLSLSGFEDTAGYEMVYLPTLLYGSHVLPVVCDGYRMTDIASPVDHEMYTAALDRSVNMLVTTPTLLSFLADVVSEASSSSPVKHNIQTIATFGSKLSAAILRKATRILAAPSPPDQTDNLHNQDPRGPHVVEIYGATEVKIIGSKEALDASDTGNGFLLADGVEARVVPKTITQDDDPLLSREAQVGDIFLRSDTYMMGYVVAPIDEGGWSYTSPVDEEGWFYTGDVGYLSGDGKILTLTGRTRTTINYEGEEVDVREVLQIWEELFPEVEEMYVLPGNQGADGGESAVLFALAGQNFEFEKAYDAFLTAHEHYGEAIDFYRSLLVGTTHVVCFVDAFPRVGRGKVNLKQVGQAYAKLVAEKKFDAPETYDPRKWWTVFQLEWLSETQEFRVVEWEDDEF